MRDVARRAGVSATTASYVLSGRKDIKLRPDTRQQILTAADELGYVRTSTSGKKGQAVRDIGLLTPEPAIYYHAASLQDGAFQSQVLAGVSSRLNLTLNPMMLMCFADMGIARMWDHIEQNLRPRLAGVIGLSFRDEDLEVTAQRARQLELPVVLLNREHPLCSSVLNDDRESVRASLQRMVELGHRRIALVNYLSDRQFARRRHEVYRQTLAERNIPLNERYVSHGLGPTLQYFDELVDGWLRMADRPTAALCTTAIHAQLLWQALISRGLRVPDDVSIVSFGLVGDHVLGGQRMTCILEPGQAMGQLAAELLASGILVPGRPPINIMLPCGWREGQTLGPAPQGA